MAKAFALPSGMSLRKTRAGATLTVRGVVADPLLFQERGSATIHLQAGARAVVVLSLRSSVSVSVVLDPRSVLTLFLVVTGGKRCVKVKQSVSVGEGAVFEGRNLTAGSVDQELVSVSEGRRTVNSHRWVFLARSKDRMTLKSQTRFAKRGGAGAVTIRGGVMEQAHVHVDGGIDILRSAAKTDASLREEVLLLDPQAQAHVVPGLSVRTDDVKASHSASVTRLSPEDLFYFASRGIAGPQARRLVVGGMVESLFADLEPVAAQMCRKAVMSVLPA